MSKSNNKPRAFESTGGAHDEFSRIYESMLRSQAFKNLSKNQRLLYMYMKAQFFGKRKPGKDYPENEALQNPELFYFNKALAIDYGLYTMANTQQFYNDVKALIAHGFIEKLGKGNGTAKKAIYRFSAAWKQWKDTS